MSTADKRSRLGPQPEIAVTPPALIERLLAAAGPDLVLVGGQALGFWMDRYGIHVPSKIPFISRDIDFLAQSAGDKAEVIRLANVIGGTALIPSARSLTALVGQAVRPVGEGAHINIDVVFEVFGASADKVRDAALDVEVEDSDVVFRVMHPMDVLKSRLDNLYGLREKQNELGEQQLAVAIEVAKEFQRRVANETSTTSGGSRTLPYVKFIERLAQSDAGTKVAQRHGVHVADAIAPEWIRDAAFRGKKLPRLLKLMSAPRQLEVTLTCQAQDDQRQATAKPNPQRSKK